MIFAAQPYVQKNDARQAQAPGSGPTGAANTPACLRSAALALRTKKAGPAFPPTRLLWWDGCSSRLRYATYSTLPQRDDGAGVGRGAMPVVGDAPLVREAGL